MIKCNGKIFDNYYELWQAYKPQKGCVGFTIIDGKFKGENLLFQNGDFIVKPHYYKDGEFLCEKI